LEDKIEFSFKDHTIHVKTSYSSIINLTMIVSHLSKFPLVFEQIKDSCGAEDAEALSKNMSILGHTKPLIKPSEFK
jgi:hypothetical protein